jgi:hypothetical protein
MSGRDVNSDSVAQNCAPSAARVPFYDWTFHPDNKWWTFSKGHGTTNTRFGRFERRQFITGNPSTPASPLTPAVSHVAQSIVAGSAENPIIIDD